MSDNWIVQNLNSALNTWNEKLAEIWTLLTQSPESFKGGTIWSVITGINGALTAIGYGLLVLFFAAGIVKTCGSFTDMKKPEHALKAFIRFALAQGAIMYGMELMTALFSIVQGIVSTIMAQSGMASGGVTELPAEIVEKIEAVGMLESIPLWIVTLLGSLLITVLSFIMILTVYGRMFKLYMYTAIAPIPISTFAGEPSQSVGKNFIKSYAGVCLEGAIIALACMLCIRRRSELSGDVAAFPWMRPVLRYGVGCMGGLALGMILYSVTFGLARTNDIRAYLPGMLLCVVLMTLVCSFGMSMLLGKSLKIFRRTWKGTVLLTALLAAVCVCVRMDVAGVERRVPKTSEIESISVQCSRANSFTATSEDTETIEAIRAIHRAVLDQMKDGDVDLDGALVEDGQYIWIRLKYTLTDGSALERAYNVPVRRASALYTAINHMMSTPQVRQTLVFSGEAEAGAVPQGGTIYSLETGDFRNLTAAEAQSLYQAAWQDVEEGNVISDILTETGYTLLQVDINGRNWDCALDTRYFTDGAKTLAVLDRFMRNGWSNADGLTETTEDS